VKACSVYAIDYEEDRFDACLALSLLEHLEEPELAMAEIRRVVKPHGLVLVQVPFAFPIHGYPNDFWRWTEEGLNSQSGLGRRLTLALVRPLLTLAFLTSNLLALFLGLFERKTSAPLGISCLARNIKA
jgi:ubiquinone/menaquinone biosynthesis C-methylase UbiE